MSHRRTAVKWVVRKAGSHLLDATQILNRLPKTHRLRTITLLTSSQWDSPSTSSSQTYFVHTIVCKCSLKLVNLWMSDRIVLAAAYTVTRHYTMVMALICAIV
eukprot:1343132-Amorphochlora_amoeboformis.AAC.2